MAAPMREIGFSIRLAFLMLPMVFGAANADQAHQAARHDQPIIHIDTLAAVERFPDIAVVGLGVSGDAPDDQSALAGNAENVLHLLAAIREAGVPAKDIEQER